MSALPPGGAGGGYGALHLDVGRNGAEFRAPAAAPTSGAIKRKRRPAGTPDPGAEVVALSPKTLMESDRYVCEICNQGFQRDQNLQMHRRRHKVPWKLLKRPSLGPSKRVYVCPERSCLHHDPAHALGDLVGIKKHYRRKHCTEKQWRCERCSKSYAVQSDYKAHLKTCGTRGHCCDCGRVFSRVESFIEHQDTCSAVKPKAALGEKVKSSVQDRTSTGSRSQSSDTTQAMSFQQSDAADEHLKRPQRQEEERQPEVAAATASAATRINPAPPMPPWLKDHALQLLADHSDSSSHFPHLEAKAIPEPSREPSLHLSMGPYGAEVASSTVSSYVDTKPSLTSVERPINVHHGNLTAPTRSRSDIGLSVDQTVPRNYPGSLSGLLMQGMRRVGPETQTRVLRHHLLTTEQSMNRRTEVVAVGSASSCHQAMAPNMHESGAQEPWVISRRAFAGSEPATSSVVSCRPALLDQRHVVVEDHTVAATSKFVEDPCFRPAPAQPHQPAEEVWSGLARARRTRDEARQECDEAQRDLVRAEVLRREARAQLQIAAAERAYADRAREAARRQIEASEAELARAKRLREQAQSVPALCHSCKSALEASTIPPRSVATPPAPPPPVPSTSPPLLSFMTPEMAPPSSDQAPQPATAMTLWLSEPRSLITEAPPSSSGFGARVMVGASTPLRTRDSLPSKLDLDLN